MIINGRKKNLQSKDLKVGQFIIINTKQRVPCDILILSASEASGTVFIRTDQLDGETDWKIRRAIRNTQEILKQQENPD